MKYGEKLKDPQAISNSVVREILLNIFLYSKHENIEEALQEVLKASEKFIRSETKTAV